MTLYDKLEFDAFKNKLKNYSFSNYGKIFVEKMLLSDSPKFDYDMVKVLMKHLRNEEPSFNITYVNDILERLKNNIIEPNDLVRLKKYFEGVEKLKSFIFKIEDLSIFFSDFTDYSFIIKKIDLIVNQEGKIKNSASDTLSVIRKQLAKIKSELKDKTNRIMDKYSLYLQERMITYKNGRLVLPFKSSFKNKINGVVQSLSSTGATAFIEPQELVYLNNEIRSLESKERFEIIQILTSISNKIRLKLDSIIKDQSLVAFFDSLYARAVYAIKEHCTIPELNETGYIKIVNGRNPLIDINKVVPLNFELGKDYKIVVVTGPNTGGKTVVLKTIGIFSLMARMAIPIPADYANISFFDNIFVDIGDEQAIQQNLSTFSSHMKNVIKAINNIGDNTLLLLDELGAGTDPTEGSALAVAIVDYLLSKNVRAVVTTHYNELKIYAYSKKFIENASMQFDVDSLKPTYRLLMGIPGSSNAFEILKRLGMKNEIIEKARKFKGKEYEDIDVVIREIHKEKFSILNEKERLISTKKQLELKMYQYDSIIEKVKRDGMRSLDRDYEKLKNMKKEIETMISEARKSPNLYELKKTNKKMEEFLKEARKIQSKEEKKSNISIKKTIKIGDWVVVGSTKGKVIKIVNDKAKVDLNGIIVESKLYKLRKIESNFLDSDEDTNFSSDNFFVNYTHKIVPSKIDLRGYNVEDAIEKVENFILDLKYSHKNSGIILHGKGTGALMKAIHAFLRNNKEISKFYFGGPNEGGEGVTIIEL